jgi:hypothetical protein
MIRNVDASCALKPRNNDNDAAENLGDLSGRALGGERL